MKTPSKNTLRNKNLVRASISLPKTFDNLAYMIAAKMSDNLRSQIERRAIKYGYNLRNRRTIARINKMGPQSFFEKIGYTHRSLHRKIICELVFNITFMANLLDLNNRQLRELDEGVVEKFNEISAISIVLTKEDPLEQDGNIITFPKKKRRRL